MSYFIKGKMFHVEHGNFSKIYEVSQANELADKVVKFLSDLIHQKNIKDIRKIILQSGPMSFTSLRIIYSITKSISVINRNIEIVSVPSFLTYLSIVSAYSKNGILAIPTMRGDFFTCQYRGNILYDVKVQCVENMKDQLYIEDDEIFDGINLAVKQREIINTRLFYKNLKSTNNNIKIIYESSAY
ncbi:MAG: hypothetical protein LBJ92_00900 [Holosporales bacterium]|nr:hypothetical protein [Holosporales bacterium]